MKKTLTRLLAPLLFLGGIIGIYHLSQTVTDGFTPISITSTIPYHENWDIPIRSNDQRLAEQALAQSYSYLESGSQSYVFISEDNRFVIKFFKHKRWRLNPFVQNLPLPLSLEKKRQRWLHKKQETVESTFQSCIISYQDLKEETGMIYLHLNKTNHLKKHLEVSDRIGLKHQIDLDGTEFTIQHVAIPTDTYLLSLRESGQTDLAKKAITDLLNLTVKRAHMGYSDKDPHLINNFGFIEGKATQIDTGGFHHDPRKDRDYFYGHELKKIRRKLLTWIEQNYPELSSYTKNQISLLAQTRQPITP